MAGERGTQTPSWGAAWRFFLSWSSPGPYGSSLATVTAGLAVVLLFLCRAVQVAGPGAGLPLDDAWIHLRFAGNLAAGNGFAFNPGESVAGSTSPLWVVFLALFSFLPGGRVGWTVGATAATYLLAVVLTGRLAARLVGQERPSPSRHAAGVAAGLLAAVTGRFAWAGVSGMEVPLFACLTLGTMLLLLPGGSRMDREARSRQGIALFLAGLSVLARPEGWLLVALVLVLILANRIGQRKGVVSARRIARPPQAGNRNNLPLWWVPLPLLAPAVPWVFFCLLRNGSPLPSTFGPNGGGLAWPDTDFLFRTGKLFWSDNPFQLMLAVAGGLFLVSEIFSRGRCPAELMPAAWVLLFPLAASMVAPNLRHHGRYNMPLLPVLSALAIVGVAAMARWTARWWTVRSVGMGADGLHLAGDVQDSPPHRRSGGWMAAAVAATLAAACLGSALHRLPGWATTYGWNVENIRHQQVAAARWLAEHGGPGCQVATHDIGAMGVLSGCKVYDLIGLVTPPMARLYRAVPDPARRDPLIRRLLVEGKVTHVAIYPQWFPSLAADPALQPVFHAALSRPTIVGGRDLVVYRARW